MSETGKTKQPPDLEKVELLYRAGVLTLRQIGKECGISHARVIQLAKEYGWTRDLKAKIVAKAAELVTRATNQGAVTVPPLGNQATAESEVETIDINGTALANVLLRERKDIGFLIEETAHLSAELRAQRECLPALSEWIAVLAQDANQVERDELKRAVGRTLSLAGRVAVAKTLAETLSKLIPLERQAWDLDNERSGGNSDYEKLRSEVLDADGNPL